MNPAIHSRQRLQQFTRWYDELNAETISLEYFTRIYHPDICFIDPFHQIDGVQVLRDYFAGMYRSLEEIHFTHESSISQDQLDSLTWTMTFRHPAIGGGKAIEVQGVTQLTWQNNRVIRHRDYFDGGQMLYEHLPLIGWTIGKIKRRMAAPMYDNRSTAGDFE